MSLLLLW